MSQTITYYISGSSAEVRRRAKEMFLGHGAEGNVIASVVLTGIVVAHTPQNTASMAAVIAKEVAAEFNLQNVTVRAVTSD